LFKTIFPSCTHCTVIYTLSIGVWVECTNRTRYFYRMTWKKNWKKYNIYRKMIFISLSNSENSMYHYK